MTYASEDLTDDTVFEEFSSMVDVDNLLQYFAIETYIANWDWPQNNIKMYRYYSPGDAYGEDPGRMEDGDISIMTWRQDSISTMPQQKSGEAFRMHWTAINCLRQ